MVEYSLKYFNEDEYQTWGKTNKTLVILSGGSSCHTIDRYSGEEYVGSMEEHAKFFEENGVKFSTFYESDMNDMLSGIFLRAEERVCDFKKYPDYGYFYSKEGKTFYKIADFEPTPDGKAKWIEEVIGGNKNYLLREYLRKMPLWK